MVRTRLTVLALFASLLLLPALAGAAPAATPRSHAAVHSTAPDASLLARLLKGLRSLWGKGGMLIDPNGVHVTGTTTTTTTSTSDAGVLIDPNG